MMQRLDAGVSIVFFPHEIRLPESAKLVILCHGAPNVLIDLRS